MDPQKKKKKWAMLYVLTGVIDGAQLALDFIPIAGEILNEIIDPFIGILLGMYFWYKGIMDIATAMAFFIAILCKEGTFGALPAWIGVTGFVHFNYLRKQVEQNLLGGTGKTNISLNHKGVRSPESQIAGPLNEKGVRAPNKDLAPLPLKESQSETPKKIVPMRSPESENLDMAA